MKNGRFNKGINVNEIIKNGYTFRAGTVSGNSIEVIENCLSYVYYEDKVARDEDLKTLEKLVADARK